MQKTLECVKELKARMIIFSKEYNLPPKARELLSYKAERICKCICKLKTNSDGKPNQEELKAAEQFVLDCKDWLVAFAEGYELADEAVNVLHQQYEQVVQKITQI